MSDIKQKTQRYRVLGWVAQGDGSYITKGKTIYQCDSLDEALSHLKNIHNQNVECSRFTIERGEWL